MCVVDERVPRVDKVATLRVSETFIMGVTLLDGRIYVICDESNIIAVFTSQQPFRRLQDIVVNGLWSPGDIAASVNVGCLYVIDSRPAVWRISVDNGAVVQWLTGLDALTVSVTVEDKVVLLVMVNTQGSLDERNWTWLGEVHVYSSDAVLETVIKLSPNITNPLSIILTTRKTFIVSCGLSYHEVNRVCEVDMTGRVLKAFGSSPGDGVDQLYEPLHASLDDEERVIVADSSNQRVLLLNKQLTSPRVLVTWHAQLLNDDDDCPVRLHYDRHTGTLLVGLGSGHVDVYKVK